MRRTVRGISAFVRGWVGGPTAPGLQVHKETESVELDNTRLRAQVAAAREAARANSDDAMCARARSPALLSVITRLCVRYCAVVSVITLSFPLCVTSHPEQVPRGGGADRRGGGEDRRVLPHARVSALAGSLI